MTRELNIWSWVGADVIEVTPGVIDGNAREAFKCGQCHALALALNERLGWELGGIGWECGCGDCGWDEECDFPLPGHVVVRSPEGELLDIDGFGVESRWSHDFEPVTPDVIQSWADEGKYHEPQVDVAREFVPAVLREYGVRA